MTAPTESAITPEEFLSSGGAKSATWANIGDEVEGEITDVDMVQQRDYDTDEPKVYKDTGRPVMQMRVIVQTGNPDPTDDRDDGRRAIYVRGQLRSALTEAMKAHQRQYGGGLVPEVGGRLAVKYERDQENPPVNGKPRYPTKVRTCRYTAPRAAAAEAYMAAPAEAPGGDDDAVPPGVDPARWAAMSAEQRKQLRAVLPPF